MTPTTDAAAGQVSMAAARVYERDFVPALFGQFAPMLVEAAEVGAGQAVLDVGCGTGIAALAALGRVGPEGSVTGLDLNPGMLAVARTKADAVDWIEGAAEALPFDDDTFDIVLCQFALMFFADRTGALREMARVARPGGRIALLAWEALERTPGYDRLVPLLRDAAGPEAAGALAAPFVLGDPADLAAELARAGLTAAEGRVLTGTARHASLDGWLDTEIGGWTLAQTVSTAQLTALKAAAAPAFAEFIGDDGTVAFPAPARLLLIRV